MTDTIAATYNTLVMLVAAIDNPATITAAGLLNNGLQVFYESLTRACKILGGSGGF